MTPAANIFFKENDLMVARKKGRHDFAEISLLQVVIPIHRDHCVPFVFTFFPPWVSLSLQLRHG